MSSDDDIDALIRSMEGAPMVPEAGSSEPRREGQFVRPRPWFEKPVKKIRDGRDAFAQFAYLVKTWSAHEHPETTRDATQSDAAREFFDRDKSLAEFVRENPGVLEDALLDSSNLRRLAAVQVHRDIAEREAGLLQGGLPHSILDQFLAEASPMRGELLWQVMAVIDKARLIEFIVRAASAYGDSLHQRDGGPMPGELIRALPEKQAHKLFKKLAKNTFIAPEWVHVLELQSRRQVLPSDGLDPDYVEYGPVPVKEYRLPEILPADAKIASMKPDKILTKLAEYTGSTPERYNERLVRANIVGVGQHAGEVVRGDAARLKELGVERTRLAETMSSVLGQITTHYAERAGELQEQETAARETGHRLPPEIHDELHNQDLQDESGGIWWRGSEGLKGRVMFFSARYEDPFHAADTSYLSEEVGGGAEYFIINEKKQLSLLLIQMHPYLIRRACFFQGG